jgi:hypothetical protein
MNVLEAEHPLICMEALRTVVEDKGLQMSFPYETVKIGNSKQGDPYNCQQSWSSKSSDITLSKMFI